MIIVIVIVIIITLIALELPLIKHISKKYRRTIIKLEQTIGRGNSDSDDEESSDEEIIEYRRNRRRHREKSSPRRRKRSHNRPHGHDSRKRSPKRKDMTVKVICEPLHISPEFKCVNGKVDVTLDISGGVHPYRYKWNTGSMDPFLNNLPFNDHVTVTVTDARNCSTTVNITTPAVCH